MLIAFLRGVESPWFFVAQLLLDGRFPQNPACQSGRGRFGLRPVGGLPADHPPLLPAASVPCVADFPAILAGFPKKGLEEGGAAN